MPASTVPQQYQPPLFAQAICLVLGFIFLYAVASLDRTGHWLLAGVVAALSSYGAMAFSRYVLERGNDLPGLLDLSKVSWAFAIGDLFLGASVAAGSYIRYHEWNGRGTSDRYFIISALAGLSIGLAWHYLLDRPNYMGEGAGAVLGSPTKITHDLLTYTALAGSMVFVVIPVLFSYAWNHQPVAWAIMLACGLVWVGCAARDNGSLSTWNLHPVYDWKQHHVVPRSDLPATTP